MSFNIEQVRKAYQDPAIAKISEMTKRIARLEADNVEIETDDVTGLGDLDHTNVIYTDYWNFANRFARKRDFVVFDGTNDYIDLGVQTNLWSKTVTNCSFSIWANPSALATAYNGLVGIADVSPDDAEFSLYFTNIVGGTYKIGTDVTSNNYSTGIERYSTRECSLTGHWYHCLVTFDHNLSGTDRLKLYVDGFLQSNANDIIYGQVTPIDINSNTKAYLGWYNLTPGDAFNGKLRDFRWWNRTLTDVEAYAVFRDWPSPYAPTPDYWLPLKAISTGNPVDKIAGLTTSLSGGAYFPDRTDPLVPFEPDYLKLRLDLRFRELVGQMYDHSQFGNSPTIFGEPCPATGSQVYYTGNYRRNAGWGITPEDQVYMRLPTSGTAGAFDVINEQSWIFRLNFRSLDDTTEWGTRSQTLVEKWDSATDQYFIRVGADGNIKAGFMDGGADVRVRTSNSPIRIGEDHEIVVTYNSTGDVVTFYVDGYVQPQTTTTENYDGSTFTTDLWLLSAINGTPEQGVGYCDLNYIDLIRYYDDTVLTLQQVRNHFNNKFSISNIEQGLVAVTDASVVGAYIPGVSFTDTSFSSTSFTTG